MTIRPVFDESEPAVMRYLRGDPAEEEVEDLEDAGDSADEDAEESEDDSTDDWASTIEITVERIIPGFSGLPFCYELAHCGGSDRVGGFAVAPGAVVRVVAAPGVNVRLLRRPTGAPCVRVQVFRIQDPFCVPALGEPINATHLLMGNGVPMHRHSLRSQFADDFPGLGAVYAMAAPSAAAELAQQELVDAARAAMLSTRIVTLPQRDGMLFFDNLSERMLRVVVPMYASLPSGGTPTHEARFAYLIRQGAADSAPAVYVAATPGVEVTQFLYSAYDAGETVPALIAALPRAHPDTEPFGLIRASSFDSLGFPGEVIRDIESVIANTAEFTFEGWRLADGTTFNIEFIPMEPQPPSFLRTMLTRIAIDVAIGHIPFVGDLVDFGEFCYALGSGRDRWGERVTPFEIALMGLGTLTPFVGNREVRLLAQGVQIGYVAGTGYMMTADYLTSDGSGDPPAETAEDVAGEE